MTPDDRKQQDFRRLRRPMLIVTSVWLTILAAGIGAALFIAGRLVGVW